MKTTTEGKLTHLTHLEDLILDKGVSGTREAIDYLRNLRDMLAGDTKSPINLSVKFDGSPSLVCGINPDNGKFFVGTKGVFSKEPKLNYTNKDIDENHPGEGLNKKLKIALEYLPELNIKGVIQGDLLFTSEDISYKDIHGENYLTFQPNTIVYAIPSGSKLAKTILGSKIGIVFHTSYRGKTFKDLKASFGANVGSLKQSKNVWFRDADFTDASGTANFTERETEELNNILSQAGSLFRKLNPGFLNRLSTIEEFRIQVNTYNNTKVRAGEEITNISKHIEGLIAWVTEKANKEIITAKMEKTKTNRQHKKQEILNFYVPNKVQLSYIFALQNLIVKAKHMIIRKLETVRDMGTFLKQGEDYKVTAPEGFVAVSHITGNAIKLVDRLTFSHANFNIEKSWKK